MQTFDLEALRSDDGFFYLATPYSLYSGGLDDAFREAARASAWLIERGVKVFSPITHGHPIAIHGGLDPLDCSVWIPLCFPMMLATRGLIVCMMRGWNESKGIGEEIAQFERDRKPVHYMPWPMP